MKDAKPKLTKTADMVRALATDLATHAALDDEGRKKLFKERFKDLSLAELVYMQASAQAAKEYVDALAKFANAQFDALRLECVPAKMDEEGIETVRYEEIGRVSLSGDIYLNLPSDKREEFFKWLRKNKLGSLITEQVNSSTLRAFVKERMQKGKDVPRELLNVTPYTRASITKA